MCGVYNLQIQGTSELLPVYCKNGWTTLFNRGQYGNSQDHFDRTFPEMEKPFGDPEREAWMGLENMFILTNSDSYVVKVELLGVDGEYNEAFYDDFRVIESSTYKLSITGYNASISTIGDSWSHHHNKSFITKEMGHGCYNNFKGPNWFEF